MALLNKKYSSILKCFHVKENSQFFSKNPLIVNFGTQSWRHTECVQSLGISHLSAHTHTHSHTHTRTQAHTCTHTYTRTHTRTHTHTHGFHNDWAKK